MTDDAQASEQVNTDASTPSEKADDLSGGITSGTDDDFRVEVSKALGLEKVGEQREYRDQVERIIEWARTQEGVKDNFDIKAAIDRLAERVGKPHLGNNWAQHLSIVVHLEMERMRIDKELKDLEMRAHR